MNPEKKALRVVRNRVAKIKKAADRKLALVKEGKLNRDIAEGKIPDPALIREPRIPRLSWLNAKTYKLGTSRKNAPGRKPEAIEAFVENASRAFAVEIEKAGVTA